MGLHSEPARRVPSYLTRQLAEADIRIVLTQLGVDREGGV